MIPNIVLWSLFVLICVILAILFIPYRLSVAGNIQWFENKKTGNAHIHFGGTKRGISISPFPIMRFYFGRFDQPFFSFSLPKKKEPKIKKDKMKPLNKKFKSIKTYTILGKEALDEIHFDQFFLNGKLGFPNPMHTGMIFGWSQLLGNFIRSKNVDISISPQFNNRFETDIRGNFRLKFIPGKVLWKAVKTYFKFKK